MLRLNLMKIARILKVVFLAFWITVALSITLPDSLPESKAGLSGFLSLLQSEMPTIGVVHSLVYFAFLSYMLREKKYSFDKAVCTVSGVLALLTTVGMSFAKYRDFSFFLFSKKQMVIAVLVLGGYWILLYKLLRILFEKLDSGMLQMWKHKRMTQKQFGVLCIAVLLLCWIPMELLYFPGSIPHDTRAQLNMYFDYSPMSAHHPFFCTMMLGALYDLGQFFFGEYAVAVCIALQNILGVMVFSGICGYIYKKSGSLLLAGAALAYYALYPAWWTYMQAYIKDSLFFIFVSWYALVYLRCCLHDAPKHAGIQLAVTGLFVCFLRFNGAVLVFPSLLLLFSRENRRMVASVLCTLAAAYVVLNYAVQPLCIEEPGHRSESMTIPLQQIARYVYKHEDELTQEEKEIIDRVVVYDNMGQRYDPDISDPIKNRYRNATDEEWSAFFKLWREKFFEHPLTYIEATMNHAYGYMYPFYFEKALGMYQIYNKEALGAADADVVYSEYVTPNAVRAAVNAGLTLWKNLPVLSTLINPGLYAWILIVSVGAAVRRRDKQAWMFFILPTLNILCCVLSPVNGLLRYALPTMALMPLYVFVGVCSYCEVV